MAIKVMLSEALWTERKPRTVTAYHVSNGCDKIDASGAIQPRGMTGRTSLGGNSDMPFMISAYNDEVLAENLAYYYLVVLLLTKHKREDIETFRDEVLQQIQVLPSVFNDHGTDWDDEDDARDLEVNVEEALEEIAFGVQLEGIRKLYKLSGALDPLMNTDAWTLDFPSKARDILEAAHRICIYKIQYAAEAFQDSALMRGVTAPFMSQAGEYFCRVHFETPASKMFDEMTEVLVETLGDTYGYSIGDLYNKAIIEGEKFSKQVSRAVGAGQPLVLQTSPVTEFREIDELLSGWDYMIDALAGLDIFDEAPDGIRVGDLEFVSRVSVDPEKVVSFNQSECELRFFTKGIPVVSKKPRRKGNYAVKIKTAAEIFQEVQQRYIDRGYTFAKGEFGLFYIPEKGWGA